MEKLSTFNIDYEARGFVFDVFFLFHSLSLCIDQKLADKKWKKKHKSHLNVKSSVSN